MQTMALLSMRPNARRLADASSRAVRRTSANAWPLLQGTAAATAAWVIAKYVLDHEQPFFAPIAATLAGGFGSMAIAIFAATALARALGGTRIVIAQAGVGAILTVAVADADAGVERLTDAKG